LNVGTPLARPSRPTIALKSKIRAGYVNPQHAASKPSLALKTKIRAGDAIWNQQHNASRPRPAR